MSSMLLDDRPNHLALPHYREGAAQICEFGLAISKFPRRRLQGPFSQSGLTQQNTSALDRIPPAQDHVVAATCQPPSSKIPFIKLFQYYILRFSIAWNLPYVNL